MSISVATMTDREYLDFDGELRVDEPMSKHTSWRVGGPADRFYIPSDMNDLVSFLEGLPENEQLYWVGLGSNILVRDGGIPGTVIFTRGHLKKLELRGQNQIYVEAGTPCAHIARYANTKGLVGAEFFAGIPGTIGGALAMNAGAFGGETWDLVDSVVTIDRWGNRQERTAAEYQIGYRSVIGPQDEWFVATRLRLSRGDTDSSRTKIRRLLAQRAKTQPTNIPSCGSVFRNPEPEFAAGLIEASDLKGARIGGACVSEKHANFILNTGGASAHDIESLIDLVVERVVELHGIRLQPEVRIIGEKARLG